MHKRKLHERVLQIMLNETFINVFSTEEKKKYIDQVWDILQASYAKIGGIHGSGFESKADMIATIPFWKLVKKGDKIVAVALYKDKNGRKRIAAGTDGSDEGKAAFASISGEDLSQSRSYSELSGPSLSFVMRRYKGDFKKHLISPKDAEKIAKDTLIYPVSDQDAEVLSHPELKDYFYQRKIGGQLHTKLMVGTPNKALF